MRSWRSCRNWLIVCFSDCIDFDSGVSAAPTTRALTTPSQPSIIIGLACSRTSLWMSPNTIYLYTYSF